VVAALGLEPGDEVIVPAYTWVATANVVEYMGAKPVFCDNRPGDVQHRTRAAIEPLITERTVRPACPSHPLRPSGGDGTR